MVRRGNIGSILMAVLLAEVIVFFALAERIGFGATLMLTLAFSLLGAAMLRRSGASAAAALRDLSAGGLARQGAVVDGMLGALGALLLVIPGFVSDLVGLVLIAPSGRQWLMRRFGLSGTLPAGAPRSASQTIDLGAEDWRRIDNLGSR